MSVRAPPIGPVIVLKIAEKIPPNCAYAPVGKRRRATTSMLAPKDIAFAFIPSLLREQPTRASHFASHCHSASGFACQYLRDQGHQVGSLRRNVPPEAPVARQGHGETWSRAPRSVRPSSGEDLWQATIAGTSVRA